MILPAPRDPRLTTVRRGGTLSEGEHHLLALWAADCAEHVLPHYERAAPGDDRPREAIEAARAWVHGRLRMMDAKRAAGAANAAARDACGAARLAALAAGQAAVVAHVAAHDLGAAAYAIRAARAAAPEGQAEAVADGERRWQRDHLPAAVRELVIADQARRNDLCWGVFAG